MVMARILIVEDDAFFADILACTLKLEGHETTVANNADEGVRLGLVIRPEVVIADWLLRNAMNGGEVCRRIRAAWPHIKTIIITGHQELVPEAERYCNHAESVVAKPFHKEEILGAVRAALTHDARFPLVQIFNPNSQVNILQSVC